MSLHGRTDRQTDGAWPLAPHLGRLWLPGASLEPDSLGWRTWAAVLTPGWFSGADLTEIQCDMSDVSRRYQALGAALRERQQQLSAMLDRMQEVQEEASSMLKWLESKERTLSELDASSSPTKTETMRAQAEHNKVISLPDFPGS